MWHQCILSLTDLWTHPLFLYSLPVCKWVPWLSLIQIAVTARLHLAFPLSVHLPSATRISIPRITRLTCLSASPSTCLLMWYTWSWRHSAFSHLLPFSNPGKGSAQLPVLLFTCQSHIPLSEVRSDTTAPIIVIIIIRVHLAASKRKFTSSCHKFRRSPEIGWASAN